MRRGLCEAHDAEAKDRERIARLEEVHRNRADWLEKIGVPPRLRPATFEDSTATRAIELVRGFFDADGVKRGRLIGFVGPTGVGKSWGLAALVNETLVAAGVWQRWVLVSTLLRELGDFKRADAAMERACTGQLLVLDDLSAIRGDAAMLLDEIFIRREQAGLALAFTSNLPRAQLEAVLSDRVIDRVRGWGTIHEIRGKSLRG